jgi:cysteinyl-tRNA synthetase
VRDAAIDALVTERDEARQRKDYARADAIKAELLAVRSGFYRIALLDEPQGTFWYWTTGAPAQ